MLASPFCFFLTKQYVNIPMGTALTGASNAREYEEIAIFDPISHFISKTTQHSHSYYGRQIENCTQAFEWYQFLDTCSMTFCDL